MLSGMTGGSGEPPVTNIDFFIPGHGPGTLLLAFRTAFSYEKERKPESLVPEQSCQKEGETTVNFHISIFALFPTLAW